MTASKEFLQVYSTAVRAAGGAEDLMVGYFHMALKGSARSWFMNLPPGSVRSWRGLCRDFLANFQGTAKCPGTEVDLDRVVQRDGETLRKFVQRFSQVRNTIPKIRPERVVYAFQCGVRDKRMLEELATRNIQSPTKLFKLADECAHKAEARTRNDPHPVTSGSEDAPSVSSSSSEKKIKIKRKAGAVLAVAVKSRKFSPGSSSGGKKAPPPPTDAGKWCQLHETSSHDQRDCCLLKAIAEATQEGMLWAGGESLHSADPDSTP